MPKTDEPMLISAVRDVIYPSEQQFALDSRFDDPAIAPVTPTVTEQRYRLAVDGRLGLADQLVAGSHGGQASRSTVGRLVRGLPT